MKQDSAANHCWSFIHVISNIVTIVHRLTYYNLKCLNQLEQALPLVILVKLLLGGGRKPSTEICAQCRNVRECLHT